MKPCRFHADITTSTVVDLDADHWHVITAAVNLCLNKEAGPVPSPAEDLPDEGRDTRRSYEDRDNKRPSSDPHEDTLGLGTRTSLEAHPTRALLLGSKR